MRKNVNQPAIDSAEAGDESVAGRPLLFHAKIGAAVRQKLVQLFERAFIQEQSDTFTHRQFASFVLARAPLGASALFRRRIAPAQLFDFVSRSFLGSHSALALRF